MVIGEIAIVNVWRSEASMKRIIIGSGNDIIWMNDNLLWAEPLGEPERNRNGNIKHVFFIRPFEKRTYYAMAMSVRLSVRPSVRPSFPDFFSTCFEISIWNLVYAFSRWHDMSSLSFITIGSLWPSLQPKVGQTQFLQSWPYKSR